MTSDFILQLQLCSVHSSTVESQSHVRIIVVYESYHVEPVWLLARPESHLGDLVHYLTWHQNDLKVD